MSYANQPPTGQSGLQSALPLDRRALRQSLLARGWCRFPKDAALLKWVDDALPVARAAVAAPENAHWLRCGGTWFAGVNSLGNDAAGAVPGGRPLAGSAVDFIREDLGLSGFAWDAAQISVCYPGYPQAMPGETAGAFRYRAERDAAHLDGLLAAGPARRRFLGERHGFLLGIPMTEFSADAAPFVVWQGSHHIIRDVFSRLFADAPAEIWGQIDVTAAYHQARRKIFESCSRVEIAARPGEAYLLHRLALHGVAPWGTGARAGADGRMIVYFRPETGGPDAWLTAP